MSVDDHDPATPAPGDPGSAAPHDGAGYDATEVDPHGYDDGGPAAGYEASAYDGAEPAPPAAHVPPHDLHAEQAVLGALMLSEQARYAVTIDDGLRPDDFYSARHRVTFDAIRRLYGESQPVDAITVVEQLRRDGTLQEAGGREAIWTLTAAVTEVAALPEHSRIVRELGKLRRLLQATYEIQTDVLRGQDDPADIVEQAQSRVFEISQTDSAQGLKQIGDTVDGFVRYLEELEKDGRDITGLPTGFRDLDVATAGLQPGAMIVLAARPAMGKSALVTNLAENVALQGKGAVALFSLEMPERELLQRIIASQAAIKGDDVRKGRIGDRWPDVLEVADTLAQSPLYIDDSSDIGIMEIRAKARRLAASHQPHGVALVIVDYLQLMRADGRSENRVQQVGEMSRGLKILAQELSCPVIALSQLSRGVESRPDKRPMLSDLRECVTGDTLVCLADGRRVPIAELVGEQPEVLAVDGGRIVSARSDLVWSVGVKPVLRLRLASGRTLRATAEHRVLAGSGWMTMGGLAVGDRVALGRRLPEPAVPLRWPDDHVVLLGHLVGDGSYVAGQPMRYTTACEEGSRAVREAAERSFDATVNRHEGRGAWHQLVISGNGNRWRPAGVGRWLKELGIFGQRSAEKHLPRDAFRLADDQVALLLRHLWATDGSIWSRRDPSSGRVHARVHFSTCSPRLAADVAALLLRLGIVARTAETRTDRGSTIFSVNVTGFDAQRRFVEAVGVFGERVVQAEALLRTIEGRATNTNVDTLPREVWSRVRSAMATAGMTQRAMATARGTSYGGASHFRFAPSRKTLAGYAEILGDEELRAMAGGDLFWDRVVAVEADGEEEVFDLTVPGPACWLADGIVTHNSGNIEQDADQVMFLYRDDYYNPETTEEPGVAELIIAKNRSGRLATVKLLFQSEYPRFLTMAQRHDDGGPPAHLSGPPSGRPAVAAGGPPLPGGGPPLPRG